MRRLVLGMLMIAAVAACSGAHKQPTGPAPEYEDAPPPSWMKDAGAPAPVAPAPAAADAGVS